MGGPGRAKPQIHTTIASLESPLRRGFLLLANGLHDSHCGAAVFEVRLYRGKSDACVAFEIGIGAPLRRGLFIQKCSQNASIGIK